MFNETADEYKAWMNNSIPTKIMVVIIHAMIGISVSKMVSGRYWQNKA